MVSTHGTMGTAGTIMEIQFRTHSPTAPQSTFDYQVIPKKIFMRMRSLGHSKPVPTVLQLTGQPDEGPFDNRFMPNNASSMAFQIRTQSPAARGTAGGCG